MVTENIVGLCDIDWNYSKPCFDTFPKARKYCDWRRMFDELSDSMAFTNISASETMEVVNSFAFEMVNGRPKWNVENVKLNALEPVQEYIKHTYKNGWSLPQMPS